MIMNSERPDTAPAVAAKAPRKANSAQRRARVMLGKAKSGTKAGLTKKAPTHRTKIDPDKPGKAREGSKTAKILDLLKQPGGVTSKELMKVTGWQPHSVRGFLSGTIGKKMGLTVTSTRSEAGERAYSVKA